MRHIDSARSYKNEAEVGKAVRDSGQKREDVFITTKCNARTHGYDSTLKAVDESLEQFGFDYIDLVLIHDPFKGKEMRLATYRALLDAKAAGKIRTVGVSNFGVKHLEEIKDANLPLPSVNQLEIHPFCQQRPIVDYCRANDIVLQAYCPLLQGKKHDDPLLVRLSANYGKDVAQILIRWSLQKGFVPLPKSAQPGRILSNTKVFDFELSCEDMAALDALDLGQFGAVSWNPIGAD
jgi:diketogulonate reductase-like aldo/keto reductase